MLSSYVARDLQGTAMHYRSQWYFLALVTLRFVAQGKVHHWCGIVEVLLHYPLGCIHTEVFVKNDCDVRLARI
jgi:hypothetical protein